MKTSPTPFQVSDVTQTIVSDANGKVIHDGANYDLEYYEAKANAMLFRVAPELLAEMKRYLPILERAQQNPEVWEYLTSGGTGIATINGYKAVIQKAEGYEK